MFRCIVTESSGDVIETAQALVGLSVTANVSIAVVAIYMESHEIFVFWVRVGSRCIVVLCLTRAAFFH